ncbi:MAG: hypothetical protein K6T16_03070 [Candidatus Pacearchaeota archaeon]|nr:hypothetical protein [Candidatus Pacearchaeota archaeon]
MIDITTIACGFNTLEDIQVEEFSRLLDRRVRRIVRKLNKLAAEFAPEYFIEKVKPYTREMKDIWDGVVKWYKNSPKAPPKLNRAYCI